MSNLLKRLLLGRGVLGELNTLGDVALEALVASLEELLLGGVGRADHVVGLLDTIRAQIGLSYPAD